MDSFGLFCAGLVLIGLSMIGFAVYFQFEADEEKEMLRREQVLEAVECDQKGGFYILDLDLCIAKEAIIK